MAYTDLVIQLAVTSISEDGGQIIIEDNTEYAPPGENTPTWPELSGVQRWIFYRKTPFFNQDWTFLLPNQVDPPWTLSLLNEDGNPFPDSPWQFVMVVVDDALSYTELLGDGFTFDDFVNLGINDGAAGQLAVVVAPTGINCVNDARRRLNNAWAGGKCDCSEYALKKALLQGAVSNAAIAGGYTDPILPESSDYYDKSQEILDKLTEICADESCLCNC